MQKLILLMAALSALTVFSGCNSTSQAPNTQRTESYYSQTPMSELEYQMYIAGKISTAVGQINTHMAKIQDVAEGSCKAADEIADIEASITILKDDKDDLTYMYPPDSYAEHRERALGYWQDAIDVLDKASDEIEQGISQETAVELSTELKSIYTSIQALNT